MDYISYLITGSIAGILAGMLGVGGGLVIVPILYFIFIDLGFNANQVMHIALATSLATIIFTSLSSINAHHKYGAINWDAVKKLSPGILIGAFGAGWLANFIDSNALQIFFSLFLFFVSVQMVRPFIPSQRRPLGTEQAYIYHIAGIVIGAISALVGIGGGTLTVPFLHYTGFSFPKAIATSAACGLPIALAATLGFIVSGWGILDGPFVGYIYLPAWLSIVVMSVLFAPLGAKLAHTLPVATLKKVFAIFLVVAGFKMLF